MPEHGTEYIRPIGSQVEELFGADGQPAARPKRRNPHATLGLRAGTTPEPGVTQPAAGTV